MEQQISYAIYPSLLDAFTRFKRKEDEETFDSLFNRINKVKTEQTEQQLRGIAFERLISEAIFFKDTFEFSVDARYEGFMFSADLINAIADKLQHRIAEQQYMECILNTQFGNIKLYGVADFVFPEMIVDLKGTENYKCSKYKDYCQAPEYSLICQTLGKPIKAFKYLVSDYTNIYQETYVPSENMYRKLMITIYEFINFIEHYRSYITDQTIFGLAA